MTYKKLFIVVHLLKMAIFAKVAIFEILIIKIGHFGVSTFRGKNIEDEGRKHETSLHSHESLTHTHHSHWIGYLVALHHGEIFKPLIN